MSIRIYIGNLPQGFNPKEFDTLLKSVSDSIRFKAVLDKETKECRGFGFATTNKEDNDWRRDVVTKHDVIVIRNLTKDLIAYQG